MLRDWQKQCIEKAMLQYENGQRNFLAVATPGAGKTRMAANLANRLFDQKKIDLVVCFTPSINVSAGFKVDLEKTTARRMDGKMGSYGQVLTYHTLTFLSDEFWDNFNDNRVFVIFDEIHHCGGHELTFSNVWGEKILSKISQKAIYTLALSGTPWRSDKLPIALAKYSGEPSRLECDYIYSLTQAIKDNVCRIPKIVAIDNNDIRLSSSTRPETQFASIKELLSTSDASYHQILNNEFIVSFLLKKAVEQLKSLRKDNTSAAGLIVASSISHAHWISDLLKKHIDSSSVLVAHTKPDSHNIINGFEQSSIQWIISIGMVSEGINIPRLQVCCNLSRIKTELYFRQVLGRIIRRGNEPNKFAYMYMLAEENLLNYAHEIQHDLPDHLSIVKLEEIPEAVTVDQPDNEAGDFDNELNSFNQQQDNIVEVDFGLPTPVQTPSAEEVLNKNNLSLFGQFFEELITIQKSDQ